MTLEQLLEELNNPSSPDQPDYLVGRYNPINWEGSNRSRGIYLTQSGFLFYRDSRRGYWSVTVARARSL